MALTPNRLSDHDWVTVAFYPLMVILMESSWIFPWLVWMTTFPNPNWQAIPLGFWSIISIIGGAFIITRYFPDRNRFLPWVRLAMILLLVFVVVRLEFLGIQRVSPPMVAALVVGAFLSWRGIRLGRSSLHFGEVARLYIIGMVALILLIVIVRVSPDSSTVDDLNSSLAIYVTCFFFFGTLALALGNMHNNRRQVITEGTAPLSMRRWLPVQLAVVAIIVLLGIGVASIFSSQLAAALSRLISGAYRIASQGLAYILYPFAWLAQQVVTFFEWLINLLGGGDSQVIDPSPFPDNPEEDYVSDIGTAPKFFSYLKWVLFAVAVVAAVAFLKNALSRLTSRQIDEDADYVRESLGAYEGLKEDLRLLLRAISQRLRRLIKRRKITGFDPRHYSRITDSTMDIREIYRHLLWEGAKAGVVRRESETPTEYGYRLSTAKPGAGESLHELTYIYVACRYGAAEPINAVERANHLWRFIRGFLSKTATVE